MTKKELEYELGRYKKKVSDQQGQIERLKGELAAKQQSIGMSEAFLALVLKKSLRGQANPVRVTTEEIGAAVGREEKPCFQRLGETNEFLMWHNEE